MPITFSGGFQINGGYDVRPAIALGPVTVSYLVIGGGGGGGGGRTGGGNGGSGGGGYGGGELQPSLNGQNGTPNTGSGGGGYNWSTGTAAGSGGNGVVILRYLSTRVISIGVGLTYSTASAGGDTVVTFTAGTGTVSWIS